MLNKYLTSFLIYCFEVFPLLYEDIKQISKEKKILVEGAHILPELVYAYSNNHNNIFLISTKKQQRQIWIMEMLSVIQGGHPGEIENYKKSEKKRKIAKKRVDFHDSIALYIKKTAKLNHQKLLVVNNKTSEESIELAIAKYLGFA